MRPFSVESMCPKCGENRDIETRWIKFWDSSGSQCLNYEGCIDGQHIHRTCMRCGYGWSELPLDAEKPNEKSD